MSRPSFRLSRNKRSHTPTPVFGAEPEQGFRRTELEKIDALALVIQDPTRSQRDKDIARAALDKAQASATDSSVSELLLFADKPLAQIAYHDVHNFCSQRGWRRSRGIYDEWLHAHFNTDAGHAELQRAAEYLR